MAQKLKTAKQMERHFKGAGNHYRLEILLYLDANDGTTVETLVQKIGANYKTISQHTRSLVHAGLIEKHYQHRTVICTLSPYGKLFVKFIKEFQRIGSRSPY